MNKQLKICKNTRLIASKSLLSGLKILLQSNEQISEALLRNTWLSEVRKHRTLFSDGWYEPPPHGMGILFGGAKNPSRLEYTSLRSKEKWPKKNVTLNKNNGAAYLYASPVDRKTGIIGDFGISLYFGKDPLIKKHLQNCLKLDYEIFDFIEIGKTFGEVFEYAKKRFKDYCFAEPISISTTEPAGVNIGHTVPSTNEPYNKQEQALLKHGKTNWNQVKTMISTKRKFLNSRETLAFQKGMAVTTEPRPTSNKNPYPTMASYHTIATIDDDGGKELLTNFNEIFELVGMDYMLDIS